MSIPSGFSFEPLSPEKWEDLEQLFGKNGASGGCWCMWWRLKRSEFDKHKGDGNRLAMKAMIAAGEIPGIIAYQDDIPAGWCSVAPRDHFPRLDRSRILKKVDESPVWSVVCFFVSREYRKTGLSLKLLLAAVEYVRLQGGLIVEGYPYDIKDDKRPDPSVYTGLASIFKKAGFTEVERRSDHRPIMRFQLQP